MANIKSFPNNQDEYIGAEDVMKWLHGRTSGVFAAGDQCAVAAVPDSMAVTVSDGNGWTSNAEGDGIVWWISNEKDTGTKLTMILDMADATLPRIDRVVVSWPTTNYVAYPEVLILKGTPASNPVPPDLTNNNIMRQISLAQIRIPAGATAVTNSMITDERLNPAVCGLVTESLRVDTSVIHAQLLAAYQEYTRNMDKYTSDSRAAFEAWFQAVRDALSGDVAGNLQNQIDELREAAEDYKVENKSYVDTLGLVTATHAKTGTVHALTAPAGCGNLKFVAAAPFADGDTITLNGTAVTPKTQDGEALYVGAWAAGAVVMCLVSPDGGTLFFKGGGGTDKSEIIVTAPSGCTVTASCGSIVKTASEKNGTWTFKGCGIGTWKIQIAEDGETADGTVDITWNGQLMRYYISIDFYPYPDDFDFGQFGIKGADYEIVQDDGNDTVIAPEDYRKYKNWKCRLLTSGNGPLVAKTCSKIDVFCVGGGGGSTRYLVGGGGYTKTQLGVRLTYGQEYPVIIGASGGEGDGGNTEAFGVKAAGGKTGTNVTSTSGRGGDGGSGGPGVHRVDANSYDKVGVPGTDGNDGTGCCSSHPGGSGQRTKPGPNGETGNTREFGEESGKLYSDGGANSDKGPVIPNSGYGCPKSVSTTQNSGIVVFRPHKKEAS